MHWPDLSADEVLAAVEQRWDLSGAVPVPRGEWLACPVCRAGQPQPRYWKWHMRPSGATLVWRCDVAFKCTACSACWIHGVAVPRDYYERHVPKRNRRMHKVGWRKARRALEGNGG